jgi:hypothetical protein
MKLRKDHWLEEDKKYKRYHALIFKLQLGAGLFWFNLKILFLNTEYKYIFPIQIFLNFLTILRPIP